VTPARFLYGFFFTVMTDEGAQAPLDAPTGAAAGGGGGGAPGVVTGAPP
jgi:hypothetical protein